MNAGYDGGNEIVHDTEVSKSNICDYNETYILPKRDITIARDIVTLVAFRNCAPFTKCITKIDGTTVDTEDLDLLMAMYKLLEYSTTYTDMTGILSFYFKDEVIILARILKN